MSYYFYKIILRNIKSYFYIIILLYNYSVGRQYNKYYLIIPRCLNEKK